MSKLDELPLSPRAFRLLWQVMDLPWEEQLDIADFLQEIHGCPPGVMSADDPNFEAVLDRQLRKLESGETESIPAEEVYRMLDEKYRTGPNYPPLWFEALRERLAEQGTALSNYHEVDFQIELCDVLTRDGHSAIREYPYRDSDKKCDLAIVSCDDCRKVQEWIEFKPVQFNCQYWTPSKFFEGRFQNDISKLSTQRERRCYFLLFAESEDETFQFEEYSDPEVGRDLYVPEMANALTTWAGGREPFKVSSSPIGSRFGHLFLWLVNEYADVRPEKVGGVYKLVPTQSNSNTVDRG